MRLRDTRRARPARPRLARDDPAWCERVCVVSALCLLPPFLGAVALAGSATHLRLLLFPPLAAIGYALFLHPYGPYTSLRNSVLGPVTGALVGTLAVTWVPAGPLRVIAVTAAGILALRLLRVELPPALAVALLTLLVGGEGLLYLASIAASSLALALLFRAWRGLVFERLVGDPAGQRMTRQVEGEADRTARRAR
jgi:CBS-domain-containing membrane protein